MNKILIQKWFKFWSPLANYQSEKRQVVHADVLNNTFCYIFYHFSPPFSNHTMKHPLSLVTLQFPIHCFELIPLLLYWTNNCIYVFINIKSLRFIRSISSTAVFGWNAGEVISTWRFFSIFLLQSVFFTTQCNLMNPFSSDTFKHSCCLASATFSASLLLTEDFFYSFFSNV